MASAFAQVVPAENFKVAAVENLPFEKEAFDLVISSSVLHFAENLIHFETMLNAMWGMLKPGGYFFCRLASEIGIESFVRFTETADICFPMDQSASLSIRKCY